MPAEIRNIQYQLSLKGVDSVARDASRLGQIFADDFPKMFTSASLGMKQASEELSQRISFHGVDFAQRTQYTVKQFRDAERKFSSIAAKAIEGDTEKQIRTLRGVVDGFKFSTQIFYGKELDKSAIGAARGLTALTKSSKDAYSALSKTRQEVVTLRSALHALESVSDARKDTSGKKLARLKGITTGEIERLGRVSPIAAQFFVRSQEQLSGIAQEERMADRFRELTPEMESRRAAGIVEVTGLRRRMLLSQEAIQQNLADFRLMETTLKSQAVKPRKEAALQLLRQWEAELDRTIRQASKNELKLKALRTEANNLKAKAQEALSAVQLAAESGASSADIKAKAKIAEQTQDAAKTAERAVLRQEAKVSSTESYIAEVRGTITTLRRSLRGKTVTSDEVEQALQTQRKRYLVEHGRNMAALKKHSREYSKAIKEFLQGGTDEEVASRKDILRRMFRGQVGLAEGVTPIGEQDYKNFLARKTRYDKLVKEHYDFIETERRKALSEMKSGNSQEALLYRERLKNAESAYKQQKADLIKYRQAIKNYLSQAQSEEDRRARIQTLRQMSQTMRAGGKAEDIIRTVPSQLESQVSDITIHEPKFFERFSKLDRFFSKFLIKVGTIWSVISGIRATFAGLAGIVKSMMQAEQFTESIRGYVLLGQSATETVENLGKAMRLANDSISRLNLSQAITRSRLSGLASEAIPKTVLSAKVLSRVLGIDATEAFSRLSRGIAKQEGEILDELGIVIRATTVFRDYAKSIGRSVESLSDQEKQIAYSDAVLGQLGARFVDVGYSTAVLGTEVDKLKASWQDFGTKVGEALTPLGKTLADMARWTLNATASLLVDFQSETSLTMKLAKSSVTDFGTTLAMALGKEGTATIEDFMFALYDLQDEIERNTYSDDKYNESVRKLNTVMGKLIIQYPQLNSFLKTHNILTDEGVDALEDFLDKLQEQQAFLIKGSKLSQEETYLGFLNLIQETEAALERANAQRDRLMQKTTPDISAYEEITNTILHMTEKLESFQKLLGYVQSARLEGLGKEGPAAEGAALMFDIAQRSAFILGVGGSYKGLPAGKAYLESIKAPLKSLAAAGFIKDPEYQRLLRAIADQNASAIFDAAHAALLRSTAVLNAPDVKKAQDEVFSRFADIWKSALEEARRLERASFSSFSAFSPEVGAKVLFLETQKRLAAKVPEVGEPEAGLPKEREVVDTVPNMLKRFEETQKEIETTLKRRLATLEAQEKAIEAEFKAAETKRPLYTKDEVWEEFIAPLREKQMKSAVGIAKGRGEAYVTAQSRLRYLQESMNEWISGKTLNQEQSDKVEAVVEKVKQSLESLSDSATTVATEIQEAVNSANANANANARKIFDNSLKKASELLTDTYKEMKDRLATQLKDASVSGAVQEALTRYSLANTLKGESKQALEQIKQSLNIPSQIVGGNAAVEEELGGKYKDFVAWAESEGAEGLAEFQKAIDALKEKVDSSNISITDLNTTLDETATQLETDTGAISTFAVDSIEAVDDKLKSIQSQALSYSKTLSNIEIQVAKLLEGLNDQLKQLPTDTSSYTNEISSAIETQRAAVQGNIDAIEKAQARIKGFRVDVEELGKKEMESLHHSVLQLAETLRQDFDLSTKEAELSVKSLTEYIGELDAAINKLQGRSMPNMLFNGNDFSNIQTRRDALQHQLELQRSIAQYIKSSAEYQKLAESATYKGVPNEEEIRELLRKRAEADKAFASTLSERLSYLNENLSTIVKTAQKNTLIDALEGITDNLSQMDVGKLEALKITLKDTAALFPDKSEERGLIERALGDVDSIEKMTHRIEELNVELQQFDVYTQGISDVVSAVGGVVGNLAGGGVGQLIGAGGQLFSLIRSSKQASMQRAIAEENILRLKTQQSLEISKNTTEGASRAVEIGAEITSAEGAQRLAAGASVFSQISGTIGLIGTGIELASMAWGYFNRGAEEAKQRVIDIQEAAKSLGEEITGAIERGFDRGAQSLEDFMKEFALGKIRTQLAESFYNTSGLTALMMDVSQLTEAVGHESDLVLSRGRRLDYSEAEIAALRAKTTPELEALKQTYAEKRLQAMRVTAKQRGLEAEREAVVEAGLAKAQELFLAAIIAESQNRQALVDRLKKVPDSVRGLDSSLEQMRGVFESISDAFGMTKSQFESAIPTATFRAVMEPQADVLMTLTYDMRNYMQQTAENTGRIVQVLINDVTSAILRQSSQSVIVAQAPAISQTLRSDVDLNNASGGLG